uniref:C2 domain-containing protein n=1 Tax=Heterorhabditis bacteriophora TaxID=37862 RepID=A0A1I7XMD3_HETBA
MDYLFEEGQRLRFDVDEGKHQGNITVTAEKLSDGRQESIYFVCSATKLDRKDFLGKCDPFLKISRINHDNTLQLAYRSRYKEQNLNPKWKPFEIHIDQLCYGDKDREFLIECFDWDEDGNHDLVGSCTTTINRLVRQEDISLPLINDKKARKSKKYIDSGILHFQKVYCWMDYSFLDFVTTGTELDFTVAVAFPRSWDDETRIVGATDQYDIALRSIAEICQYYNVSQSFNAYGFGARPAHMDKSHAIFPLNIDSGRAYCEGVSGLLAAYKKARSAVHLSGPAHFAPVIRFIISLLSKVAAQRASRIPSDASQYSVLLIITDGIISDLKRTKQEIVKASCLPLSIIIVGIGYDTFEEMRTLDSDQQMLSWNGKSAKRDIVQVTETCYWTIFLLNIVSFLFQFVQLRLFLPPHKKLTDDEQTTAKRLLAKEVLQEIPLQLTSYMKSKGISPCHLIPQRQPSFRGHQSLGPSLSAALLHDHIRDVTDLDMS